MELAEAVIADVERRLEYCENYKKNLLDFFHELNKNYTARKIDFHEYQNTLDETLKGKSLQEWLNYLDKCIAEHKSYLKRHRKKQIAPKLLAGFYIAVAIFLIFAIANIRPTIVGYVIEDTQNNSVASNATLPYLYASGFSVRAEQPRIELGKPVKWKKIITMTNQTAVIKLPRNSENITLRKISGNAPDLVTALEDNVYEEAARFDDNITEIELNNSSKEYELEYETPAPMADEKNISAGRKVITIYSEDELNYTDILAHTYLPSETEEQKINFFWIVNGSRERANFSSHDTNNNSLADYIEWVVPHLSNQTYEIIIKISRAEHLDESRSFVSDVYNETSSLDGIWSEEIADGHYVRVTFEKNLTGRNDITIYPRITGGTPEIRVFEGEGNELIAVFDNVTSEQYNQVYLASLEGEQDTFDLKVTGGTVEFDYITDPSTPVSISMTNEGILAYIEGTVQTPRYRWYNTTTSRFSPTELSATSVGAAIEHIWLRCAPNRFECALLTADASDDLKLQFYSYNSTGGLCWHNGSTCGQVNTLETFLIAQNGEKAALEYENSSGDLLIVWANTSVDGVEYALWNGTGFVYKNKGLGAIATTGSPQWIETVQEPGTNSISMIYSTSTFQAGILIWDGDSNTWGCEMPTPLYPMTNFNRPRIDIAHEQISGDLFAVIGLNATQGARVNYVTKARGSCIYYNFTSPALTEQSDTTRVAPVWGTDRILITDFESSGDDAEWLQWTGTAISSTSPGDTSCAADANVNELITGACIFGANKCVVVYSDTDATNLSWATLVPTTDTWATKVDIKTNLSIAEEAIRCFPYPLGPFADDKLLCMLEDDNNQLLGYVYDSSADTWYETNSTAGQLETNTALAEYRSSSFDFRYSNENIYEGGETDNPPTVSLGKPNDNYINSTSQYVDLTFNASVSDDNGLVNCSLWHNATGVWNLNQTKAITGTANHTEFSIENLENTGFIWNINCYDDAGQFSWGTDNRTVKLNWSASANNAPKITFVSPIPGTDPVEAGKRKVAFNVYMYDADGVADLNDSSVSANFSKTGEPLRQNSSCVWINDIDAYRANYSCTIDMWYWDASGSWNVNAKGKDDSDAEAINTTSAFQYNLLQSIVIFPSQISFSANTGVYNQTATNDPITINNTGNAEVTSGNVQISAFDLYGETITAQFIGVSNFSVGLTTGAGNPECAGTALQNGTYVGISSSSLSRGNLSQGGGIAQEQLYYCIRRLPLGLSSQVYSTKNGNSWIITILVGAVFSFKRRKKKKSKEELTNELDAVAEEIKEKYSLNKKELIEVIVEKLAEKYHVNKQDISTAFESKREITIPASIFEKELGCLEAVIKYMKENLAMSYHEIAQKLARDDRTVWTAYKKSAEKKPQSIKARDISVSVPISIMQDRRFTVFESVVLYLYKKGLRYNKIAEMLGRDQRNVWTVCSRAMKKMNRGR